MPTIRAARPEEATLITDIALRSKAHWAYTDEQMAVFRGELTVSPEHLAGSPAYVIEDEGVVRGFYTLGALEEAGLVELDHLFIDPEAMRGGLGRRLLEHARKTARADGYTRMKIQSDPNAAGFYESLGARKVGDIPSSIPGRTLPHYELDLA